MKKITLSLFIVFQTITMSSLAAPIVCEDVFLENPGVSRLSEKGTAVVTLLNNLEFIQPFVDPANAKVSWNSFEALQKISDAVDQYTAELQQMTPEQRHEERKQLLRLVEATPTVSALFDIVAEPQRQEYLPTQYDLKRQLTSKMIAIIKNLPPEFRPKVGKLHYDQRRQKLNKDAANLMAEQERRFDSLFEGTGFKNYAEYESSLRKSTDPLVQKAIQLIDRDQIEVAMRRPENGRFWIPKTGFQNQFISGTSRGTNNKTGRYNAES